MDSVGKRGAITQFSTAVNAAFGAKLRGVRRSKDISQGDLASRVGVSRVTVATIEGGRQNTQLQHIFLFARALNVPVESLVPTIDEVQSRIPAEVLATIPSGALFLQDARALLRQLRSENYENQISEQARHRGASRRSTF